MITRMQGCVATPQWSSWPGGRGSLTVLTGASARMKHRILIVADVWLYREGLEHCLRENYDVVGSIADGPEAVQRVLELRPELALVDMAMLESAETVRAIVGVDPHVRIVALAVPETEVHVLACAEAGISGYVPREASLRDLNATIDSVLSGNGVCSPRIVAGLFRRVAGLAADRPPNSPHRILTNREMQIIDLIDDGLSNKEIAQRLFIEVTTVKNHVHNILEKLQVHRRAEAAAALRRWRST
jgi:two-component system, NarL family, nitrate/nitrite response regulator NarL